jgi:hypothetical protein
VIAFLFWSSRGMRSPTKESRPSFARRGRLAREEFFLNSCLREFGVRIPAMFEIHDTP